jgi:hypothetical protein
MGKEYQIVRLGITKNEKFNLFTDFGWFDACD